MNTKRGFSLIETLIALTIMFFVIAAILSGFTNQIAIDKKNDEKNIAIALAISRLEEFQKLPQTQINLLAQPVIDYFVDSGDKRLKPYTGAGAPPATFFKQMRRQVTWDWDGMLLNLHVRVDYFFARVTKAGGRRYIFQVNLHSMRGGS